jgi:capsular polysaccharide biosynthesis protein
LVRDFGVEPVVLSVLTLDEQITLMRNARVVIGPHGAGLANVAFCSPGTVLYELLPDHYINPCVNQLAQLRGLHYWGDVHASETNSGLWRHHTPWTVDIASVELRLRQILSVYDLG